MKATAGGQRRHAMTMVEMTVAIAIAAIAIALVATAVGSARESSRRTLCLSRLRQIGHALQSYHDAFGKFPGLGYGSRSAGTDEISPYPALLPHLGEGPLFDRIDFSRSPYDGNYSTRIVGFNATVKATVVGTFLCPSDGDRFDFRANANYAFSTGSLAMGRHNGAFALQKSFSAREIADGLSKTVGVGEIRRGGASTTYNMALDFWFSGYGDEQNYMNVDAQRMLAICEATPGRIDHYAFRGYSWFNGGYENTWFNHVAGPNAASRDCSMHSMGATPIARAGSFASRSAHGSGVQVCMMDGSAHWMATGIDLELWRSLGTRGGGESAQAF